MDWIRQLWFALISELRLADILDLFFIAVVAYGLIGWFRRARSRFVGVGLVATAGVYFVARVLDMVLTLYVFETLVTVALVALVVIFQEEIRGIFERIGSGASLTARRGRRTTEPIALIARSLRKMAKARVGALVVFPGKDPLERHLVGGYELKGKLSEPLLDSIFDDSSDGHDGAIIVIDDRVDRFGVHLPLSHSPEAETKGLRHTAALGLSEKTDALVFVVSEEKGVISVAKQGSIRVIKSDSVEEELTTWFEATGGQGPSVSTVLQTDLGTKVAAALLALGIWLVTFADQHGRIEQTIEAEVRLTNVPDDFEISKIEPRTVRVRVNASNRSLSELNDNELAFQLHAAGIRPGAQVLPLDAGVLALGSRVSVLDVEPGEVTVVATQLIEVETAITPRSVGRPPADLMLIGLSVEPPKIKLRLDKDAVGRFRTVATEPVVIDTVDETTRLPAGLVLPEGARLAEGEPPTVDVIVKVGPRPAAPAPSKENAGGGGGEDGQGGGGGAQP